MRPIVHIKARLICPWLGRGENDGTALGIKAARNAAYDIGVCEFPRESNRGVEIDEYNTFARSPLGSPWCATACGYWVRHAGLELFPAYGDCDQWLKYGKLWGALSDTPKIGSVALFGTPDDIVHVEMVVRLHPYIMMVGGNTTFAGFHKNGEVVTIKNLSRKPVSYFELIER